METAPNPRPARGDLLDLEIEDLAFGGQGVARLDRFVVFVSDVAPGDTVRARVRKARRRFAEADLDEVLTPGPDRIPVPCPYVPNCGGCRLQHVTDEAVRSAKREQIVEHLRRIGGIEGVEVRPVEPSVSPFGYRNKMEYSAAPGASDGTLLGFHRRGRWDEIVDIENCLLATPRGNAIRETVRRWARDVAIVGYDQRSQTGQLRHVVVREGINTGQALVVIVTAPGVDDLVDQLGPFLAAAHPEVVGLMHATNDGVSEITQGLPQRVVYGQDWFEERISGVTLRLSAAAFFQTNTVMTEPLYRHAADAAGLTGEEVLYDLFSGVGSIGIVLAARAKQVVGIEIVPEAVRDAEMNAAANGLTNYRAMCGDVGVVLREHRDELPPPDVAIVDPPRAGLSGRAVRRILELAPKTLVYVSCQPATFADNAKRFIDGGYRLEYVQPVDMFPQTPHIEAVSRFTRD
jgi:23S rRNA (uracil1939-C5)-methyltransferase